VRTYGKKLKPLTFPYFWNNALGAILHYKNSESKVEMKEISKLTAQ